MKTRTKALLLAAALGWPGWGMPLTAQDLPGGASPQEVIEKSRAYLEAGDLGAINNLIEPEFRRGWAAAKLAAADRLIASLEEESASWAKIAAGDGFTAEEKAAAAQKSRETGAAAAEHRPRFTRLLEKTGLAPHVAPGTRLAELPKEALAALVERVDQGRLVAALDDFILLLAPETALPPRTEAAVEVTDYRIEGDRATAKAGDHLVELVRVAGRWYIAPPPLPTIADPKRGVPPRGRF